MNCGFGRIGVSLVLSVLLVNPALARELDARQKQLLADATKHQSQFESNLKLALEAAGPGDSAPSGSKARLAGTRLQSAMQSVPTLEARFAELPADDAQVAQLRGRFDQALGQARALEARLSGKPAGGAPAQSPAGKAAPPAGGGAKLDYRQEEALKGARFNLEQVDGYANALDELVAQTAGATDKSAIDYRQVARGMNTIGEARRKLGFAADALGKLPADGSGVAEAQQQHDALAGRLDAAEAALRPLGEQLQKSVDVGNYPDFNTDVSRLGELAAMFNPALLQSNKAQAAEIARTADAAREERNRITAKYADLLKQDTEASRRLAGAARHFDSTSGQFARAVGEWAKGAPAAIDAGIARVNEMAATAIAEQRPAWFAGGIPQHVAFVEEDVNLLAALDPSAAKPHADKLDALRAELKQKEASLAEKIIATNPLPPDRYRGNDRAELEAMAIAQWKSVQPDAQVLKVCIPGEQWERETMWRLQNTTWYKIDRSRLQAQVLVAKDDKLAVIRPVNLWIDHISNDKRTATNFDEAAGDVEPRRMLLRDKIR